MADLHLFIPAAFSFSSRLPVGCFYLFFPAAPAAADSNGRARRAFPQSSPQPARNRRASLLRGGGAASARRRIAYTAAAEPIYPHAIAAFHSRIQPSQ